MGEGGVLLVTGIMEQLWLGCRQTDCSHRGKPGLLMPIPVP